MLEPSTLARMTALITTWDAHADQRAIFLRCYRMMTNNMLAALAGGEFSDGAWVDRLLRRFADYYFRAVADYERDRAAAPRVWQVAHDAASQQGLWALQKLLLGVNAHINYDLVLTLVELLQAEWVELTEVQRDARYADYCHVNDIIARTIDAVQDQILEPAMPLLAVLDRLLGRMDERLISRLLTGWRDEVWREAMLILQTSDADARTRIIQQVEARALREGRLIEMV